MARGRSLSFAGNVPDDVSDTEVTAAPPLRRSLVKVESMVRRKKSAGLAGE